MREGLGQRAAADSYGVGLYTYRNWEADDFTSCQTVPEKEPAIGHLTEAESYMILRKRSGIKVSELADKIGVSRFWIHQMERGIAPIDRLREFWESSAAVA